MTHRLPPLNSLRAFEAAARHLSFTRAADDLNVTQAAVSHQIKGLEDWMGLPLFRRLNRALMLTDAGQTLFPAVSQALDLLNNGVQSAMRRDTEGLLRVTTHDSFASTWLVPRLARFRQGNPDIDVRVTIADQILDLGREGIDAAVRYGNGHWPGVEATLLMKEEIYPVCAPSLLEKGPAINRPQDLAHHTLLHDDMPIEWTDWLDAVGCQLPAVERGPGFTHSNLVTLAARAGEGVALGRSVLVEEDIAAGRLVRLFDCALACPFAYYVAVPEGTGGRAKVRAFHDWLLVEAKAVSH